MASSKEAHVPALIIPLSQIKMIEILTDAEAGAVLKALMRLTAYGEETDFEDDNRSAKIAYASLEGYAIDNIRRYQKTVSKNAIGKPP